MVNWQQLFDLHKSQGNDMPSNLAPDTKLQTANSIVLQSSSGDETGEDPSILESSLEDTGSFGVMGNLFNCISTKLWW